MLDVLGRLAAAALDFTTAKAEAVRQHSIDKSTTDRALAKAAGQVEAELAAAFEAADRTFQHTSQDLEARRQTAVARVERAYSRARQRLRDRARKQEESARVRLQQTTWVAKNAYAAGTQKAEEQNELTNEEIAELQTQLTQVEKRARRHIPDCRKHLLRKTDDASAADVDGSTEVPGLPEEHVETLRESLTAIQQTFTEFEQLKLQRCFGRPKLMGLVLLVLAGHIGVELVSLLTHGKPLYLPQLGVSLGGCLFVLWSLSAVLKAQSRPFGTALVQAIAAARQACRHGTGSAARRLEQELARLAQERDDKTEQVRNELATVPAACEKMRREGMKRLEDKRPRLLAKVDWQHETAMAKARTELERQLRDLRQDSERKLARLADDNEGKLLEQEQGHAEQQAQLEAENRDRFQQTVSAIEAINAATARRFPDWQDTSWDQWTPPHEPYLAIRLGHFDVTLAELPDELLDSRRGSTDGTAQFSAPFALTIPERCSLLLEARGTGRAHAIDVLNNAILRALTVIPPGKAGFTLIDPVGLGESFAGLMHLADAGETLEGGRIWTEPRHIEQRLADLNEHMEKVIQMYLRNEYETITEYNLNARETAEKYRFLVLADFPVNFSDEAIRRLLSILRSGAKCGVYTLIHWDRRHSLPEELAADELRKNSVQLNWRDEQFLLVGGQPQHTRLVLEQPPAPELMTSLLQRIAEASVDASRVEVAFSSVAPTPDELWSADASAEVSVAIGRSGATKLQHLTLGKGTLQHALIAGKTGAGKSTLLHVAITNLSLWFSPDEVEFYLIDFKKGVEFKPYAEHDLPHIRAVAIESDREFGLSVLQRVDQELKRRGALFRQAGVQDLTAYRKTPADERLPRTLLIIDEFQEYFVEDDAVAQNASLLLDRIVRQGRAFGIHVILGSQTLGGAYTLARTTLGQMAIRIALQCSEADSYLILSDDNPAARLLSRPGEAIYNDAAGMLGGNKPFQVVWLPENERERWLKMSAELARQRQYRGTAPKVVFAGNAPGHIQTNHQLRELLAGPGPEQLPLTAHTWVGEPNAIKDPTVVPFRRQSGGHLLIVGQRNEAALAMFTISLVSLSSQYPPEAVSIVLLDGTTPDAPLRTYIDQLPELVPHDVVRPAYKDAPEAIVKLAEEVERRVESNEPGLPSIFLFVYGLQRFSKLRHKDDFGFSLDEDTTTADASQQFDTVIREGPAVGVHIIAWCDTLSSVNRTLSRRALGEFEMRVLFQMSAEDSSSLVDSPQANKLGMYRALFYNDQEGVREKFRPYALPDEAWLLAAKEQLAARA